MAHARLRGHSTALPAKSSFSYTLLFKTPPFHPLPGHTPSKSSVPYLRLLQEDPRDRLVQGAPRDLGGHLGQQGLVDLSRPREDRQFGLSMVSHWEHHATAPYPREGHGSGKLGCEGVVRTIMVLTYQPVAWKPIPTSLDSELWAPCCARATLRMAHN